MYYTQKQLRLAHEIAEALNDKESISLFLAYTQKYDEEFLRKKLLRVMSVPQHKIWKSRAALFVNLVQYGEVESPRT